MTTQRQARFLDAMRVGPLWLTRPTLAPSALDGLDAAAPFVEPPVEAARPIFTPAPAPSPAAPVLAAPASDSGADWFDAAPAPQPVAAEAIAAMDWPALKAAAASCHRCELCQGRTSVVFGRGAPQADWFMLGSGPSRADEKSATPLSGEAGQLLDNMLLAVGLTPALVYVTNLVKCRPTEAAEPAPTAQQVAACRPFLERELALTQARTIVTLGQRAAAGLLATPAPIRGVVRQLGACAVVATYHPTELLLDGQGKAAVWADLNLAKQAHRSDA